MWKQTLKGRLKYKIVPLNSCTDFQDIRYLLNYGFLGWYLSKIISIESTYKRLLYK